MSVEKRRTRATCLSSWIIAVAIGALGCQGTPSVVAHQPPTTSSRPMAESPALEIASLWACTGICIKLKSGGVFRTGTANDWPRAMSGPGPNGVTDYLYAFGDPALKQMLAAARVVRDSPETPASLADELIHVLTVGPIVIDPDWGSASISSLKRVNPRGFEFTLIKQGVVLNGSIARYATHDYRPDFEHQSTGALERRNFEPKELSAILRKAQTTSAVDRAMLDEAIDLLLKPSRHTPTADEN